MAANDDVYVTNPRAFGGPCGDGNTLRPVLFQSAEHAPGSADMPLGIEVRAHDSPMPLQARFLPVLVALALAAAWPVAAPARDLPGPPAATLQDRLKQARSDIQNNRWAAALEGLLEVLREEPGSADVHNLLGYTYRKQPAPNLAKAFEHYRHALRIDPTHRGAHEYIGEAYLMDAKPAQARRHLAELEKLCGGRDCEEYVDLADAIARYRQGSP